MIIVYSSNLAHHRSLASGHKSAEPWEDPNYDVSRCLFSILFFVLLVGEANTRFFHLIINAAEIKLEKINSFSKNFLLSLRRTGDLFRESE